MDTTTRNPPTEIDKAYAAGIVDGEGCITVDVSSNMMPCITIMMTKEIVIRWFHDVFGGRFNARKNAYGPQYIWSMHRAVQLTEFLELIQPYVKLKRPHVDIALLMLRTHSGRQSTWGQHKMTDDVLQARIQLAAGLMSLNERQTKQELVKEDK